MSDAAFNRDLRIRRNLSKTLQSGSLHATSCLTKLKNLNLLQCCSTPIALVVHWRFQNAMVSSVVWWRWERKQSKVFVRCSWYDLISVSPYSELIIMTESWGKSLPFAWYMNVKQSTHVYGHRCILCDQQWRTSYVIYHFSTKSI